MHFYRNQRARRRIRSRTLQPELEKAIILIGCSVAEWAEKNLEEITLLPEIRLSLLGIMAMVYCHLALPKIHFSTDTR